MIAMPTIRERTIRGSAVARKMARRARIVLFLEKMAGALPQTGALWI
jgi:hypothetical protein